MKKKILLLCLLSMFILIGSSQVNAAGKVVFNVITNPGADLSKEVNVNWHSEETGTYLEYTLVGDTNFENKVKVTPTERPFTSPVDARGEKMPDRNIVSASLTNLTPNTKYMYRVGNGTTWSKLYYFTTAKEGTFSFLHITDPQYYSQSTADVFNGLMGKAYEQNPNLAFTYFTGDIIDKGGSEAQWSMFFNASNIPTNIIATTPGNHEYYDFNGSGAYFEDFYDMHNNNPKNGAEGALNTSYYFKHNNTLFISINSEKKSMQNQTKWFAEVCEQNTDVNFIIVGMHRSMYGSTYASDSIAVRTNWQKLFDRYGVDLVLSGHDHIYARSKHIYDDKVSTDPIKGTTYIIGGSGGQKFYDQIPNSKYEKVITFTSVANIITVSENEISINLINQTGATIDTLNTPIKSKRIGTVDSNFNKEAFIASLDLEADPLSPTLGNVSWPKNAYGNIVTVEVLDKNDIILSQLFVYNENLNTLMFSGIKTDRLNEFKVKMTFEDGSEEFKTFVIDNTPPAPNITIFETLERIRTALDEAIIGIYKGDN